MTDRRRRQFLALGGTAALASLAGCTGATPFVGKRLEETRTFDYEPGTTFAVNATNGDVTVRPGDGEQVRVETVKQASSVFADLSDVSVDVTQDADAIRVETRWIGDDSLLGSRPSVDVTVELPEGVEIDDLRTENGDVDVRDVTGDARLASTNGDVTARNVNGFIDLRTTNGDVTARDVTGIDGATTVNGDLELEVAAIRGDTEVRSTNGDVEAELSPDLDARVVVVTDFGDVDLQGLDLGDRSETGNRIEGTLGSVEHDLRFTTTTGDVAVSTLN